MKRLCWLAIFSCALVHTQTAEETEFFEKRVRPILVDRCQMCHSAKLKTGGIDLETGPGFVSAGLVSKSSPADSRLMKALSYEERVKMPPAGKLKADELASINTWVKAGAVWPGSASAAAAPPAPSGNGVRNWSTGITPDDRRFWSFQPVTAPGVPEVHDVAWVRSPIDNFILARLEAKNLKPSAPASKATLLRRVTFDLTGLPPTEAEFAGFLGDNSPDAFERVVDRLLASPRYGERWGRRWLDVARYADSTGNDEDHRYPYAWRYRDYVIDAFNNDMPYDQFVREQVAGDLLPAADGRGVNRRGLVATGFLALGPKALAQPDKRKMLVDVWDEQIDVTSRAFLGLTVACARCHDHKFDPIQTRDYYSFMGMFASTTDFSETKSGVAKMLYVPLVEQTVYERYEAGQTRISRQHARTELIVEEQLRLNGEKFAPDIAEYMLEAWRVRKNGAVTAFSKLDPAILEKWVKFLDPNGAPPYLDEWMSAAPADLPRIAAGYQQKFLERLSDWNQRIDKWRGEVTKALEGTGKTPGKPNLDAENAPFFHAVYLDEGPLSIGHSEYAKRFPADVNARLAELRKEEEAIRKDAMPQPDMADAVQEGTVVDQKVFVRGDYASEGDPAPKVFPAILRRADDPVVANGSSGRLELAQWLTGKRNPLTARVMVNRIWLGHFGEGIVRTPDNFGKMGERPTHPELLDWLASQFMEDGWSMKRLHRMIVLSASYRMSSMGSPEAEAADPENRLLGHYNRRRLDVEEIRDGMLVIDGTIDYSMGGTLQSGFGTDGENSNGRLSLNPESIKRRMVYLPLRRSNLPSLLNLFDFGDAVTPMGKRVGTNVAPQALFAMNSRFIGDTASTVTKDLLALPNARARVEAAYRRILNRSPDPAEVDGLLTYVDRFRQKFPARGEADIWKSVSHMLLASNEYFYVD